MKFHEIIEFGEIVCAHGFNFVNKHCQCALDFIQQYT